MRKRKFPNQKTNMTETPPNKTAAAVAAAALGFPLFGLKMLPIRRPSTVCATLDRLRCPSASPGALAVAKSGMKTAAAASQGIRVEWGRPPARDYPYNPEPRIRGALCMLHTVAFVFPFSSFL